MQLFFHRFNSLGKAKKVETLVKMRVDERKALEDMMVKTYNSAVEKVFADSDSEEALGGTQVQGVFNAIQGGYEAICRDENLEGMKSDFMAKKASHKVNSQHMNTR